jgi:hypothetical protein
MNKVREYLDLVDDKKALLEYLQRYMTEERSIRFQEVLKYRTRHFTVAVEDVYKERCYRANSRLFWHTGCSHHRES